MKFTMSWLKDHLETEAGPREIAEALTDLGLEVEAVTDPAERLAGFTLGRVEAAEPHPDADRLKVCRVATDEGVKQIICGAPNAREGIIVVVARPGTYVPGIDTTIQVGKIRGVESHGMMASEREMELSEEHSGIIELPSGEIGEEFADWLRAHDPAKVDPVIEIAITPNRPDALGVRGIARDLAARGLGSLKPAEVAPVAGRFPCPIGISIDAEALPQAPHFTGRLIRGVTNGPSPRWLQDRLTRHRPAADLGAGGHHQFPDLRPQPPAPRLRRRPGLGRPPGASGGGRRDAGGAGRAQLYLRPRHGRHLGRLRGGEHRRDHGRRPHRRRGGHGGCVRGIGLVGPGRHCPDRPHAEGQLRCPLPLRARGGPGLHPPGAGGRHAR